MIRARRVEHLDLGFGQPLLHLFAYARRAKASGCRSVLLQRVCRVEHHLAGQFAAYGVG
jgi:hypothetical protein